MQIKQLTAEQEARLPAIRDEWLRIGLSTEPLDFAAAKDAVTRAYSAAGLSPPSLWLRFRSPLEGWLAVCHLSMIVPNQIGAQVWDQVKAQVWDQVREQVREQVGAEVREQVGAEVRDQVWEQVEDQVGVRVKAQVGAQVRERVRAEVRAEVREQVRAEVREQVREQVRDQVWEQVEAQVWAQVGTGVRDQVRDQVWDQVWAQVGAQVREQVRDQVWDQVKAQVWDQVWAQVRDQVGVRVKAQVRDRVWNELPGSMDAPWLSFYAAFWEFGLEGCGRLKPLMDLARHCGWWTALEGAVILQDRPEIIRFDEQKRLHCETGPAIRYRDGFSVYSWHGTPVPQEWIENRDNLAPGTALTWKNVEQRRAAAEIIGWYTVLEQLGSRTIDTDADPEIGSLIEVDIPDIGRERFLRVQCGTGRNFALPVPPEMQTALEANAWTYGLDGAELRRLEIRT